MRLEEQTTSSIAEVSLAMRIKTSEKTIGSHEPIITERAAKKLNTTEYIGSWNGSQHKLSRLCVRQCGPSPRKTMAPIMGTLDDTSSSRLPYRKRNHVQDEAFEPHTPRQPILQKQVSNFWLKLYWTSLPPLDFLMNCGTRNVLSCRVLAPLLLFPHVPLVTPPGLVAFPQLDA